MLKLTNITGLIKNEIQLEFKSKQSIGSILLFVFSSTFLAYLAFKNLDSPLIWNGIFWLMILFASINATAHSFKETQGQTLYLYTLVSARELIFSKIIYNSILLNIITFLCLTFYSLFLGNLVEDQALFILSCFLGSCCIATILSVASGIAYKAAGNSSLFNILSIPVLIPVIILLISTSIASLKDLEGDTFIHAEMYSDEHQTVKAKLVEVMESSALFEDLEGNQRTIKLHETTQYLSSKTSYYLLQTVYESDGNQYSIEEILPYHNKNNTSAWFKLLTIVFINIIMIFIAYLVFPKFWTA